MSETTTPSMPEASPSTESTSVLSPTNSEATTQTPFPSSETSQNTAATENNLNGTTTTQEGETKYDEPGTPRETEREPRPERFDLNEIRDFLRRLPFGLLRMCYEIYQRDQDKKNAAENYEPVDLKKTEFEEHPLLPTTSNYDIVDAKLPSVLTNSDEYTNPYNSLESHHQHAYDYILNGTMKEIVRRVSYEKVELNEELRSKATLKSKSRENRARQGSTLHPSASIISKSKTPPSEEKKLQEAAAAAASPPSAENAQGTRLSQSNGAQNEESKLSVSQESSSSGSSNKGSMRPESLGQTFSTTPGNRGSTVSSSSSGTRSVSFRVDEDTDVLETLNETSVLEVPPQILSVYEPSFVYKPLEVEKCGRKFIQPPFKPTNELRLLFTMSQLKLDAGQIEPLYCSIALYDVFHRQKVSEDFCFVENNNKTVLEGIGYSNAPDFIPLSEEYKKAVFRVQKPSPHIYVVLMVEKIAQQGIGIDPYLKAKKSKEKESKAAALPKIKEAYTYLEKFRQPVMWSYAPLFVLDKDAMEEENKKTETKSPEEKPINPRFSTQGDLAFRTSLGGKKESQETRVSVGGKKEAVFVRECEHSHLLEGPITFNDLFPIATTDGKNKMSIYDSILSGDDFRRKHKPISGSFSLEVQRLEEDILTSMLPLEKHPKWDEERPRMMRSETEEEEDLIHMCKAFHSVRPMYNLPFIFHIEYYHTLYVRLSNVNCSKLGVKDARNIGMRVTLRNTDDMKTHVNSQSFVAKHSRNWINSNSVVRLKQGISQVSYHQKYPQFFDEFRIDLPTPLLKTHHLVFEIFHLHFTKPASTSSFSLTRTSKKEKAEDPDLSLGRADRLLLGFAIFKLSDGLEGLKDGFHKLKVYKGLVPGYLEKIGQLEPYCNGKAIFRFNTQLKTTLYPSDEKAVSFMRVCGNMLEKNMQSSNLSSYFSNMLVPKSAQIMEQMKQSSWMHIASYVPSLLNALMYVMANIKDQRKPTQEFFTSMEEPSMKYLMQSFETMLYVLRGTYTHVNRSEALEQRDTFLSSYVQHIFANPQHVIRPLYLLLVELWDNFLVVSAKKEKEVKAAKATAEPQKEEEKSAATVAVANTLKNIGTVGGTIKRRLTNITSKRPSIKIDNPIMIPKEEEVKEKELVDDDCMKLSWFLFDLISKSFLMYVQQEEERGNSAEGQSPAQQGPSEEEALSDSDDEDKDEPVVINVHNDERFFNALTGLMHKIIDYIAELQADKRCDLATSINNELSLFIRDLVTIAFRPSMAKTQFKNHVCLLLEDYFLTSEVKRNDISTMNLRLDFLQILADHDSLVELSAGASNHFLIRFIIDCAIKCILDQSADNRGRAVDVLMSMFTKLDYGKKYQSVDIRHEISVMSFPFVKQVITEEVIKNLSPIEAARVYIICIHILKNTKKEQWQYWWVTKQNTPKIPAYLASFIGLLSESFAAVSNHPVKIFRKIIKFSCLDIFTAFISVLRETLLTDDHYNDVVEKCVTFMLRAIDDESDNRYKDRIFMPAFKQFLCIMIPRLSKQTNDERWKWCVASLLKYVEFPIRNNMNMMVVDSLNVLLQAFKQQVQEVISKVDPFVPVPDSEENIVIDKKEKVDEIKAATLDKLVERVTSDQDMDPKFREIFFLTYRSFTTPSTLLEKLIHRYRLSIEADPEGGDKITLRVVNAIKGWIEKYFQDFDCVLTTRLINFLDEEVASVTKTAQFARNCKKTLVSKLSPFQEKSQNNLAFLKKAPKPILPKNISKYVKFNLLDWNPMEIARQLTLIEFDYFKRIEPKECLSGAWAKKKKHELAPNIVALTDKWNMFTNWIASTIMSTEDIKERKAIMAKFIEIGDCLREINNYNGVTEIVSGLSNVSVHRLKKTWDLLSENHLAMFKTLHEICDQQGANRNMREALLRAPPPCIPPLAMYLKDLTFIEDGNNDFIRNNLINVFKRRNASKIILEIKQYQQTPFSFETVTYLRDIIMNKLTNLMSDDDMWDKSLQYEPRKRS